MKHIKSYENKTENKPQIGDYVICSEEFEECKNFIENNIGQIEMINPPFSVCQYLVKYENIPSDILHFFTDLNGQKPKKDTDIAYRPMKENEILIRSKEIENIKLKLIAKKYNL